MESLAPHISTQARIWKGKHSLEVFTLEAHEAGFIGGGIVSGSDFNIRYKVRTDMFWRVQRVSIEDIGRPWLNMELKRGANDFWYNQDGLELALLTGCQEVDISATPFTNTIALQKLGDSKEKTFKVIYIHIPDLSLAVVEQVYTALGSGKYKYENRNSGFSAELMVDQYGLVVEYPGLFHAITGGSDTREIGV